VIDVRLLLPVDLAVSKIGRLGEQDRTGIAALARRGLITAKAMRQRAEQAVGGYIGDLNRLRNSIEIAVRILEDAARVARSSKRDP
jgi:hypothetical protein